jgi:hypothetical protein
MSCMLRSAHICRKGPCNAPNRNFSRRDLSRESCAGTLPSYTFAWRCSPVQLLPSNADASLRGFAAEANQVSAAVRCAEAFIVGNGYTAISAGDQNQTRCSELVVTELGKGREGRRSDRLSKPRAGC